MMKIRLATIKDAEKIANLEVNSGYKWRESKVLELKDAKRKLRLKHLSTYILEKNNKEIGYISFAMKPKISYINYLAVSKKSHGKGYGKRLFKFVIDKIKNKSKRIQLAVWEKNKPAIALYKKFGFKIIKSKKKYYSNGDSKLIMEEIIKKIK